MSDVECEATAFHEAGHAIVASYLGFPVSRLTIIPDDTTDGMSEYLNPLQGLDLEFDESDDALRRKECAVMIWLAGSIAQCLWDSESLNPHHSLPDYKQAVDIATSIHVPEHDPERYIEQLNAETKKILMNRWSVVERLARKLLTCTTMSGEEVAAVLSEC